MSNPYASQPVPFTDVTSDFQKLSTITDNLKEVYIDYGSTDFANLRESLVKYIRAVYPTDYNNFVESDLGMMFIELVAYMGSVMSLKSDMLANENFITTAKDIDSVRKLFQLVGVAMNGPTSAQCTADITVEDVPALVNTLTLQPFERVFTVTSPQDGEPLTYTLYRYANGMVDNVNSNGTIAFTSSLESSTGGKYNEGILLEGAFAIQSGTFTSLDSFKVINLEEGPVIQNSVQVYVNIPSVTIADGAYRQVTNLYQASSTDDRIFEVVYSDDYSARVVFGDGSNGVSPPSLAPYLVTYRVGGGSRGNVPKSYINSLGTGTYAGVNQSIRATQVSIATGGSDAETKDHAKKYGPLYFRTQDRVVSLDDYRAYANKFTSPLGTTGKATAVTRKAYSSANIIDLYLLEKASSTQFQKASVSFKNALLAELDDKKMLTDEIVLVDGLIRTLDLVITINIDKRFEGIEGIVTTRVAKRVQNYFLVDNWDFGDPFILSDLNRYIFETDDVRFSSIDNVDSNINVEFNEIVQLNNISVNVSLV